MSKQFLTILRETIRDNLKADPGLNEIFGGRIHINRADAWQEDEGNSAGVYILGRERIDNEFHPRKDMRKVTLTFEAVINDKKVEEVLDNVEILVEKVMTGDVFEGQIESNFNGMGAIELVKWVDTEIGYLPDATRTIGAAVMTFEIEYLHFANVADMRPFEVASTKIDAKGADNSRILVESEEDVDI
jgi:hypothetical protein